MKADQLCTSNLMLRRMLGMPTMQQLLSDLLYFVSAEPVVLGYGVTH